MKTIQRIPRIGIACESGTFEDFINQRLAALDMRNCEQVEACGRDIYAMAEQIVCDPDTGFSEEAIEALPGIKGKDYSVDSLLVWILQMHLWYSKLSEHEKFLFWNTEVMWK